MTRRTALLTALAMLAFAANSVLCRLGLRGELIDPASFATFRMISGAVTLSLMLLVRQPYRMPPVNWRPVLSLFVYMTFFSFAYRSLDAGAGALILFGAVQLTMFGFALEQGERFTRLSWIGLAAAIAGLVYLVSPGLTAPDMLGAVLMAIGGIAWGAYSLLGRTVADPLAATAGNFLYSVPLVTAVSLFFIRDLAVSPRGLILAIASGAISSGCGYVVWYAALRGLTSVRAATVQLSVPVIAAIGGVALLGEPATLRLMVASVATLGGVAIVLAERPASRDSVR